MTEHDPRCEASDESDQELLDNIAAHGWHGIYVLDDGELPGWAYTIGLYRTFNHPEVIVFGLNPELTQILLNIVVDTVRSGKRYAVDELYPDLIDIYSCTFKPVKTDWYDPFLGYAEWFYDGSAYPVLQCIWPDRNSRFPWEPDFNPNWIWGQPLLFHEDSEQARAVDFLNALYPANNKGN